MSGRKFHYKNSNNSKNTYCEYCGVLINPNYTHESSFCVQCRKNFTEEDIEVKLFKKLTLTKRKKTNARISS